jgi:hypothetical protein
MIGSNQWFQQLQDVFDGNKPETPKYRDLSDAEMEEAYHFAFYNGSIGGQRNAGLRAVIAADRALQLKPNTVKCRLYKGPNNSVLCATEQSLFGRDWQEAGLNWIGPIFEREL